MKHLIITVRLYEELVDRPGLGTLLDECVALTEEIAVEYGEHHLELLDGKGWYDVRVETLH